MGSLKIAAPYLCRFDLIYLISEDNFDGFQLLECADDEFVISLLSTSMQLIPFSSRMLRSLEFSCLV